MKGHELRKLDSGSMVAGVVVLVLTALSLVGKMSNQFGFFIYPDSYYYLLIAENMRAHLHPTGTLGMGGMPFPPAGYAAMKVTYPLVVAASLMTGMNSETAGHVVSTGAAVLCVPTAYFAVKRLLNSRACGLVAALLIATSYGLTYWSGFVMSDSLSVLLAFLVVAAFAKDRADGWGNSGDLATGFLVAALLLSRPTYIVCLPFLVWLGMRRWAWTLPRIVTAVASMALAASTAALLWFPPSTATGAILLNLLPVLAGVAALAGIVLWLAVRFGLPKVGSGGANTHLVLALAGVVAILLVYAAERITDAYSTSFYIGLGRFALRDAASMCALLPGAWMLARNRRWDVSFAMGSAALALFIVYFWAEPRESRYVMHVLPFLVPVASGVGLSLSLDRFKSLIGSGAKLRVLAWSGVAVMLVLAIGFQTSQSLGTADAPFLDSAYPREVAERIEAKIPPDATVISALPWPYYFHLRHATWGAGIAYSPKVAEQLPKGREVFVLEDASLRFHYSALARAIWRTSVPVFEIGVPIAYQYGYSAVADPLPVRGYIISAEELASAASTKAAEPKGRAPYAIEPN